MATVQNIFQRRSVVGAFARVQKLLGEVPFVLADSRMLNGTSSRIHAGEIVLPNNTRIKADVVIVATRPQFTPAEVGAMETLPPPLSGVTYNDETWRIEYQISDDTHVTLYLAKNP